MRTSVRIFCAAAAVLAAARADATIYRVGAAGHYATIQQALTAAATAGATTASHDVRIQSGTYPENLRLPDSCCGGRSIRISGGWNALFNLQGTDPAATVVDGGDRGRVFTATDFISGSLLLDRLTLREGYLLTSGTHNLAGGGGLYARIGGTARLSLYRTVLRDNVLRGAGTGNGEAHGAGAQVVLNDASVLSVYDSRFQNNQIVQAAAQLAAYGGGLEVQVRDEARASVQRSEFAGNWAYGSRLSCGGGLFASAWGGNASAITVEDTLFQGNVVSPIGLGSAVELRASRGPSGAPVAMQVSRGRVLSNIGGSSQVHATASDDARIGISDTLVARGRGGVEVLVNGAFANLTNLTVADNSLKGVVGSVNGGGLTVVNTIAYRNTDGDLSLAGTPVVSSFNLVGVDPRFEPGWYELGGGSPAADAGTNVRPAAAGDMDLARRDRTYNGTTDVGAYEWYPY
ncbi:MAG: choice-of-anchor Q domain-containing protein [Vicinamibacteria bacterium]